MTTKTETEVPDDVSTIVENPGDVGPTRMKLTVSARDFRAVTALREERPPAMD